MQIFGIFGGSAIPESVDLDDQISALHEIGIIANGEFFGSKVDSSRRDTRHPGDTFFNGLRTIGASHSLQEKCTRAVFFHLDGILGRTALCCLSFILGNRCHDLKARSDNDT